MMSDSDFSDTSGYVGSYDFEDGFLVKDASSMAEDDVSSMAVSSGAEFDTDEEVGYGDMTPEERELYRNPKPRNRRATIRFQVDYASADAGHDADVEGLPSESENTEEDSSYSEFEPSESEYYSSDDY